MTHGPGLTYDLAVSRMKDWERASTGAIADPASSPRGGRLRLSLGGMLISVGEWLGGTARVTPVAGTN